MHLTQRSSSQGQFGLKKHGDFKSAKENVDEDILKVGRGVLGTVEVDLMAPLDKTKSPKASTSPAPQ
jgi:lactoylglutathione lyase